MKVATFNINNVNTRLDNLLEWLAREQPDIVCLQELKSLDARFPAEAIRDAGYHAVWRGQRSWNGVAILSRHGMPIVTRRALPGYEDDEQARYLEAAVHGILVGAVYLPNGNPIKTPKFPYKLAWFDALIAHAKTLVDTPHQVMLVGDFNVVPTDDDIYNPSSWKRDALLQPETRQRYATLLAQGWTDALRTMHPDERIYTFWDYFRDHWKRDAGLRIDHLLLNGTLAPTLRAAGVDRWVRDRPHASDHAPTWVELDLDVKKPRAKRKPKPKPKRRQRSS